MLWSKLIRVKLNERVVLFKDGLPVAALGPGRYRVWSLRLTEQRFDTSVLLFSALPEVRAKLPSAWFREVVIGSGERGVLFKDGVPVAFLRPGVHRYWTVDASVQLSVFDVTQPLPEMSAELERLIPSNEYIDVTVLAYQMGLRYEQGRFVSVLPPGRYKLWTHPGAKAEIGVVDMRRQEVTIAGQELMTRDKVTLRLTLTAEYAVSDPVVVATKVQNLRDSVYTAAQLAAREYVAGVTLDQLLEGRDEMTRFMERRVTACTTALGVKIEHVGVKDVVLPGEMKALFNRVIEAEKEAAANVILRREETAATRSLANTAKVMEANPVLLRLKELEAMKEIAQHIQEVKVVVGADGLQSLLPAQLLTNGKSGA